MSISVTFTAETMAGLENLISEYLCATINKAPPNAVDPHAIPGYVAPTAVSNYDPAVPGEDKTIMTEKKKTKAQKIAEAKEFKALQEHEQPRELTQSEPLEQPISNLEWEEVRQRLTEFYKENGQNKEFMLTFLQQFGVKYVSDLREKSEVWTKVLFATNNTMKGA
jgi:hypothetical protein